MYTTEEQSKALIDAGISVDSADLMVIAGRGKEPFKNWSPVKRTVEICKKYEGKDFMPCWSADALWNILPARIKKENSETRYELRIVKRDIPGRGKFSLVIYTDPEDGPFYAACLNTSLTQALANMVIEVLCNRENNLINYEW